MVLTNVAEACDDLLANLTAYASGGVLLAAGSATAAEGTFQVTLNAPVLSGSLYGVALVINGWGIPTVLAGGLFNTSVHIDSENLSSYCATATVTTTSPILIPWEVQLDLSAWPLIGTPGNVWHGVKVSWNAPILTVTGAEHENPTVSATQPTYFQYCADRVNPPPPPMGEAEVTITQVTPNSTGYCASVSLSTDNPNPMTWMALIDLSDEQFPYFPVDNLRKSPSSMDLDLDYGSPPTLAVMGAGTMLANSIWATKSGQTTFSFCADNDEPPPPVNLTQFNFNSVWGSGYCVTFRLETTSTTALEWDITFDLSNVLTPWNPSGYLPPGPPYDPLGIQFPVANIHAVSSGHADVNYSAPLLNLTAKSWNWVSASQPQNVQFCANV